MKIEPGETNLSFKFRTRTI